MESNDLDLVRKLTSRPDLAAFMQPVNIADLISCEPPRIEQTKDMYCRLVQQWNIRLTKEVIHNALLLATDEQLRDELRRRADERKASKEQVKRCRDCKHCIQGYTSKSAASRGYKTSVCEMRPKDKEWRGCFYSTLLSRRACEQFDPKEQHNE